MQADNQKLVGVIERIHKYTEEASGLPMMEVSGRFVTDSYLSRRIIWGNVLIKNTPASVIRSLIEDNSIACTDTTRRFGPSVWPSIALDDDIPIQSAITYCNSYGNLWDEIRKLNLEHGLNTEFTYYNNGSIVALLGVISTEHNRANLVNLSTDLGFLTDSDYLWDSTDYCNTALIAGEGDGADRVKAYIIPPSATQRQRRELYVDARDLQKSSISTEDPMSDEDYNSALLQRGNKKLLDQPLYESYECSLQLTGEEGYVFGQDYDLGDIITLTDNVIKVQVQAKVKEHLISEDKDGRIDTLVFGLSVPTITSLVKRRD